MKAIINLIGGVRAAAFLGALVVALLAIGIQSHRLDTRTQERDQLKAEALVWAGAQETNLQTITDLMAALALWKGLAADRQAEAAAAVEATAGLQRALDEERRRRATERQVIYDRNPEARQWGATRVPAELADQLRQ